MKLTDFAPHNLTVNAVASSTSPYPYVTRASSNPDWAYAVYDGGTGSELVWTSTETSGWVELYNGSEAKILHSYSVRADTIPQPNRAPKDWTMQGSKYGSTWVILDTVVGQTSWGSGETRHFICDRQVDSYNFFRVNVTATNGEVLQIAEIYLYEKTDYISNRKNRIRTTGTSLGKYKYSTIRGTPAIEVVDSPTITGSAAPEGGPYGYDSVWSEAAYIKTDTYNWIQIDFGISIYIEYVRICCGYGALVHTWTINRSINESDWYPVSTWTAPLYQYDWSPWFPVGTDVRYLRTTKTNPNYNWLAQRGMEVLLSQKPMNYLTGKGRDKTRVKGVSLGGD